MEIPLPSFVSLAENAIQLAIAAGGAYALPKLREAIKLMKDLKVVGHTANEALETARSVRLDLQTHALDPNAHVHISTKQKGRLFPSRRESPPRYNSNRRGNAQR